MTRNATMRARHTTRTGVLLGTLLLAAWGCDRAGPDGGPLAPYAGTPSAPAPEFAVRESLPVDLSVLAEYLADADRRGATMVTKVIDGAGGSLRLGDIEIVVPPGAVARSTVFQIRLPPAEAGRKVLAEFLPHNIEFAVPVTLRLPHATTTAEPGAPVVWWNGSEWVPQPTTFTADGRAEILTDHFSYYARRGYTLAGG